MSKNNRKNRERTKRQRARGRAPRKSSIADAPRSSVVTPLASLPDDERAGGVTLGDLERIARTISSGPMGLALSRPQPWATPHTCYNNAAEMVARAGGRVRNGWTFHIRLRPDVGEYVFCTPHSVWHDPASLSLVDVTPHAGPHDDPVTQDNDVLFLLDGDADPVVVTDDVILSLPLRFFAAGTSPALVDYVAGLNARAVSDFENAKREAKAVRSAER